MKSLKILLAVLTLAAPAAATAGHCRVATRSKFLISSNAVVIQQAPYAYYSVGANLQEEAVAERIAQRVLAKLQAAQLQAASGGAAQATSAPSLLQQKCARCHSGPEAKKGFRLDILDETGVLALSCDERLKAAAMVLHERMPPEPLPRLDPNEAGAILTELIGSEP